MMVFEKTPKGQEEVKDKAHGLSMIERRVLIFINGKRTLDDLKALPRVADLDGIISLLQTEGYISETEAATAKTSEQNTPAPNSPEQKDVPPETHEADDGDDLAQSFMAGSGRPFW